MGRIDFFGNAVFVPIFLVSVGLLLNPTVMAEPKTLGLAALLIVACLGGKAVAAWLTQRMLGANGPQAAVVYALTSPQAAATLAATTVGFNIGLFSESVVNAVLVLILVSVTVATIVAERAKRRVEPPAAARHELGEHVLVAVEEPAAAACGLRIASRIAEPVGGAVSVASAGARGPRRELAERRPRPPRAALRPARSRGGAGRGSRHSNFAEGVLHAALSEDATLVIAVEHSERAGAAVGGWAETVSGGGATPVAIARGDVDSLDNVRLLSPEGESLAERRHGDGEAGGGGAQGRRARRRGGRLELDRRRTRGRGHGRPGRAGGC